MHVCLNVVAVLFLCEVDNAMYMVALNERVRARVEDAGRVELTDEDVALLTRTKTSHLVTIVACNLVAVASKVSGVPLLAQIIAGVVDAFQLGPSHSTGAKLKLAARTVGEGLLGIVAAFLLVVPAFILDSILASDE